jgi:hypothetical protein
MPAPSPTLHDLLGTLDRLDAQQALAMQVAQVCQAEGLSVSPSQIAGAAQAQLASPAAPSGSLPQFAQFQTREAWQAHCTSLWRRFRFWERWCWGLFPCAMLTMTAAPFVFPTHVVPPLAALATLATPGGWEVLMGVGLAGMAVSGVALWRTGLLKDRLHGLMPVKTPVAPLRLCRWSKSPRAAVAYRTLQARAFPLLPKDAACLDQWAEADELLPPPSAP